MPVELVVVLVEGSTGDASGTGFVMRDGPVLVFDSGSDEELHVSLI